MIASLRKLADALVTYFSTQPSVPESSANDPESLRGGDAVAARRGTPLEPLMTQRGPGESGSPRDAEIAERLGVTPEPLVEASRKAAEIPPMTPDEKARMDKDMRHVLRVIWREVDGKKRRATSFVPIDRDSLSPAFLGALEESNQTVIARTEARAQGYQQPKPESDSGGEGLPDHHLLGTALCNVKHERFEQERLKAEGRFRFTCADHELSHGEKLAILTEEVGEVAQQVLEQPDRRLAFDSSGSRRELREELTQVAAVAVAWVESLFDADDQHGIMSRPRKSR